MAVGTDAGLFRLDCWLPSAFHERANERAWVASERAGVSCARARACVLNIFDEINKKLQDVWILWNDRLVIIPYSFNRQATRCEYLLTYLCPSLPVEHRPSTTPRHRTLFWAALVIPDQLVPCCFSSASVSRLQLLRGRPLFLFPCGFQVRAWRVVLDAVFLRVCLIQPYFLRSICLATGSCPAGAHRSSFRIFSCHWIL